MIAKTFEVRDTMTFIPVLAVKLDPGDSRDAYLLARAGYGITPEDQGRHVIVARLGGRIEAQHDSMEWSPAYVRTLRIAHEHITKNFDALKTGAVVDVQFILGETKEPKLSESGR